MAQLYAILIVVLAHLSERGVRIDTMLSADLRGWPAILCVWGPVLLILMWLAIVVRLCERRLRVRRSASYIDLADRALRSAQWAIMIVYAASLFLLGWTDTVIEMFGGDIILIDLVVIILPPVAGIAATWWVHYPIVRRLREAFQIRALDEGHPVHEVPSRLRYTLLQLRVNILFLLVPLLLIVAAGDVIESAAPDDAPEWMVDGGRFIAAMGVFMVAPLIARVVLELRRLPDGPVRRDLLAVCDDHRVRVRDVLLWNTDGAMINGAVMGLFGRLRYVMLTDALLESMRRDEVIAVMAHEIGHVRRHHMPWLIGTLFASFLGPAIAVEAVLLLLLGADAQVGWVVQGASGAFVVGAFFLIFGWVSRRFERQADTFAVQHLSGMREGRDARDLGGTVRPEAAGAMQSALEVVCRLNGIDPTRPSWRHGSIRWRQTHLSRIVGQPLRGLHIDRQVRRIKLVTAVVLAAGIAYTIWISALSEVNEAPATMTAATAPAATDNFQR